MRLLSPAGEKERTIVDYTVPSLYERHHTLDPLTIEEWHIAVGDVVQSGQLLITLGTPPGICDIYAPGPEELHVPHRVVFLPTPPDGLLHLGDLLIQLEPVSASELR